MASADVLCPHCNRRQKVPEHRLTETVICLVCQQPITDPWAHKVESEKKMELAIKLKGRLVSEFGTTKLEDIKSKADEYTGRFEPVDDEEEFADDTGTRTRTKTQTDLPLSRGNTTLMLESGMYAAPPKQKRLSTAARTYLIGGIVIAVLTGVVVTIGVMLLQKKETGTQEIHASGGEGERLERHPNGTVKAKWFVTMEKGIELEHGAFQEFYIGGEQKTLGHYEYGERVGTWTTWHENGSKAGEVPWVDGKEHGKWTEWHSNGRKAGEGQYIHGAKDGEWRTWHRDGRTASFARYEAGKPVGEWVEWFGDGERKSHGLYVDGLKEGRWSYWRDNGSIELEENWRQGVLHGDSFGQHRDRGRAFKGTWDNGLRTGVWIWWHINGEIQRSGEYKDGKETGRWGEWHPNGELRRRGEYVQGRREGLWEEFDEAGEIVARREYQNDMLSSEEHYFRGVVVQRRTQMQDGRLAAEWTVLEGNVKHGYEHRYHANGQESEGGAWLNGKKEGIWRTWNEEGELKNAQTWKSGVLVE